MGARARIRPVLVLLAAAALAVLAGGCGTSYRLPTEVRGTANTAGQGTYQRIATWRNMVDVQDVLLTPGGELFMVFQNASTGRGEVRQYPQSSPTPLSANFPGLLNPTAICSGGNRIFVLDQGDSSAARTLFTGGDSTQYISEYDADVNRLLMPLNGFRRPIANLASYWHVREYLLDGTPVSSFSDTNFAWVSGIAADDQGRVYVSGIIHYGRIDPYSSIVRTLEYRYRIRRYERGTGDRFVVTDLGAIPGNDLTSWRRDATYVLLDGSGFGSSKDPRGMQWAAPQGPALYFADLGNNQVQRFGDPIGGPSSFKLDIGGAGPDSMLLSAPTDVAVDSAGYVYVADAGNLRVLRYDSDGRFVQRVDWNVGEVRDPLSRPVAVAADNRQVYIADRGAGQVLRFRRRD